MTWRTEVGRHFSTQEADNDRFRLARIPGERFLELISGALARGQASLRSLSGTASGPWTSHQPIGWREGNDVYLDPEAAIGVARIVARSQGEPLQATRNQIEKALWERGHLLTKEPDRFTVRKIINGSRPRVFHLHVVSLGLVSTSGPSGPSGPLPTPPPPPMPPPQTMPPAARPPIPPPPSNGLFGPDSGSSESSF